MANSAHPVARAGGKDRVFNARTDTVDIRDRYYEPALIPLESELDNRDSSLVLDQGTEGACTGFGLAAVINLLLRKHNVDATVSARMLYEMAQKHDQWPGEDYVGSSCRGAIKGWKNMGVCRDELWPYDTRNPGELTIERAKDARSTILGAYYRLNPNLNDYHAALNETGAIYVSASVHEGWQSPRKERGGEMAIITPATPTPDAGHAFAIVGYNQTGFIVQNSWGKRWGTEGFAIWRYEDWAENISDGWVFRLAVSTPNVFSLTATNRVSNTAELFWRTTSRKEIAGHFAHFDDGKLLDEGKYWSCRSDIGQTMESVRSQALDGSISHFLIYAHGGLNSPKASAGRIAAMKEGYLRNGIYPFHMMYDTGLAEELGDIVGRAVTGRSEGFIDQWKEKLADASDKLVEGAVKKPGTALWEEMKRDAAGPWITSDGDGTWMIEGFINALKDTGVPIHMVGHSTGGILLGHLLDGIDMFEPTHIKSCSLLAPAATIEFFNKHFVTRLSKPADISSLGCVDLYNLNEEQELNDNVAYAYRKSLLYLVSNAFERTRGKPLSGMQKFSKKLNVNGLNQYYSVGKWQQGDGVDRAKTRSTSHGGFDNDVNTMNSVLQRILGKKPMLPFTKEELDY